MSNDATVRPDATFDKMFFAAAVRADNCECCGEPTDQFFLLDNDHRSAYSCRSCAEEYVEDVRAGIYEW
jgi:hypothetical protein